MSDIGNQIEQGSDGPEWVRQRAKHFGSQLVAAIERARPLCPDHRDKAKGYRCLLCEIERLRNFAHRVRSAIDTPAWLHDAAAKLLDLPSLAHGCDEEE